MSAPEVSPAGHRPGRAPASWFIRTGQRGYYRQLIGGWLMFAFAFTGLVWLGRLAVFGYAAVSWDLPLENTLILAGVPVATRGVWDWRWRRRETEWLTAVHAVRCRLQNLECGVQYRTLDGARVYIKLPVRAAETTGVLRLEAPSLCDAIRAAIGASQAGEPVHPVRGGQLWVRPGCTAVLETPFGGNVRREPGRPAALQVGIAAFPRQGGVLTDPAVLRAIALDLAGAEAVTGDTQA